MKNRCVPDASGEPATTLTSPIGLRALEEALDTWAESGGRVEAGAIFVEADPTSARALRAYVDGASQGRVVSHVLDGRFEDCVAEVVSRIGADAALVFVDPTGWKGAGMANIAPLVKPPFRDVLVNVMWPTPFGLRSGEASFR